jgi:PAS domain S-box-containing protein
MRDGLVTLDPRGVCLDTNPAFCRITGFSRDEIIGTRLPGPIGPPEELEKIEAFFQKFLREGMSENIDLTFMRKNSERFPAILSLSVVKDVQGNVTACLVAIKDITERRRAEEQRDRLFNTSIDMVCIAGFDGYFKQLNPSWQRVLGWKPEDLMSKPFLDFVHPDDREPTIASMSGLSKGETVTAFENRYLCSDGSYRWISWNSVPMMDEKLILAIARDVTDQKRMEESIREANEALAHQATELEAVNKELEAFSYSVSHDLRAPLRSADGFSLALFEDYEDKLDAHGKDYLTRVRAACQRMGMLIDDLLKLSRISREKLVTGRVDLSALARSVMSELQKSEPTRDVSLGIEDGIVVEGDQGLLKILLVNLLGNAWKFTGGRQKALIEFGSQIMDGRKTYFVRDNGVGFDMAYASKLFVPFQRLHGTGEFPGTGIGLSIVQRVIRRHGGRIWAEAVVDAGATFYFTLPRTMRSLKR